MKKSYRVKSEVEFQKVFDHKESIANKAFIIYQLAKADNQHFRVGISAGKKLGNAVKRNQIKRWIRSCIQSFEANLREDVDFIVIVRPKVNELTFKEFEQNLLHVLKLAKLFKDVNNEEKD
ncbi:MAG: ribonuclease P protein component [Streptococcaceae bacterium]|nr:ribonuclease P protein component [Streptococcaceae bacterium]